MTDLTDLTGARRAWLRVRAHSLDPARSFHPTAGRFAAMVSRAILPIAFLLLSGSEAPVAGRADRSRALTSAVRTADARSACRADVVDPTRVPLRTSGPTVAGSGWMELTIPDTPYGIAVTADGRYVTSLEIRLTGLRRLARGAYVVWAATPSLTDRVRLGVVDGPNATVRGTVEWNQFLVFVTVEADPSVERWAGPVLLSATSPSGAMHPMAGHGIFEAYSYLC